MERSMPTHNLYKVPEPVTEKWYRKVYLQSNFWRWRREQYMKRMGYKCEQCRRWAMECHHLSYDHLFCEPDYDLMALCSECHEDMHTWPLAANDNKQLELLFDVLDEKKSA
jgi:hypothetical protein